MIKPQDIVVVLWLCLKGREQTYVEMGQALGLSASESHGAVRRLVDSRLILEESRKVIPGSLCNFLIHGVPYVFPARLGEITFGMPTAWAYPVLGTAAPEALSPVWPVADGPVRGVAVRPLYRSVPRAAGGNPDLHALLALVDTLRLGPVAERRRAGEEIFKRMTAFASA